MKIITICNNKGGVGKTTTVFNLAHYFAKQGFKTLAIDTDPQLNLSVNLGITNFSKTLGDYLLNRTATFEPTIIDKNLHLISAGANTEEDMTELKNQGPMYYKKLKDFLSTIQDKYDIVVIDTAPAFNSYTTSAIYSSSVYIVLTPGGNELLGLKATIDFTRNLNKDVSGIILIKKEKTSLSDKIQIQLGKNFSSYLQKTIIRKNVDLSESAIRHLSIFDYKQHSNGAKDYKSLAEEILRNEGLR